jgi:hypothetical protein
MRSCGRRARQPISGFASRLSASTRGAFVNSVVVRHRPTLIVMIALAGLATFGLVVTGQAPAEAAGSSATPAQPEVLYEIAQRFLGDGNRYDEIFTLNKGRLQPDGGALTVVTSLDPGWILQLPADAKGPGLQFGPLPVSVQPQPTPSSSAVPHTPSASPRASSPMATAHATTSAAAVSSFTGVPTALWVVIAVIVLGVAVLGAAVAWGALFLRRRKAADAPDANVMVTDQWSPRTIDSALTILTSACDAEQIRFPGLYTVTADALSIHVLLSTPSAKAPLGWTASPDGRTWSASLAGLQTQRVPEATNERFAGLAALGTTEAGLLLLDFANAHGPISIEGPSSAVAAVVDGWLTELTGNPWSGAPQVVRLGAPGTAQSQTLEEFIARLDGAARGIAVLDDPPSPSEGEALSALFAGPDFRWIFIVKGAVTGASWKFTARDGLLTSGFLPVVRYSTSSNNRSRTAVPIA